MNNLTAREKGFMYVITLLIIVVLGYFFGVRTLNNKYEEYKQQLAALEQRKAYLDQIRANNALMDAEIKLLKEECEKLELSFIDKVESETIEQYVLDTFEKAGCPYLTNITTADVGMPAVTYPDGTAAPDNLVCLQVVVTYVTTDGYTPTQYNRKPDLTVGAETPASQTAMDMKNQFGKKAEDGSYDFTQRKGYDEFLKAVKAINAENPDCIKVNSVTASSINGYMELTAQISFYGTSLRNRLSVDDSKAPYTNWSGNTNTNCDGGFIGFPYVCDNEKSLWYGVENLDCDPEADKPFASYWANYLFTQNYDKANGNMKKLLNFGAKPAENAENKDANKAA